MTARPEPTIERLRLVGPLAWAWEQPITDTMTVGGWAWTRGSAVRQCRRAWRGEDGFRLS